ncbi:TPA: DNA cytosine methyltransferase [Stenotrophomonas maltophilia]|nr:DNA cytosine methyltransferase [Stenotrophomonas maltophilia]HDS1033561.1 DNA cytosine methyltransferase [Stenotrophomonas maltophilia]
MVDLYAGVGGMSLGAARAGFCLGAAFEWDPIALGSHAVNFPKTSHGLRDVGLLSGKDVIEAVGGRAPVGIVGGPPCQGFSSIGKRVVEDPRNSLFGSFFRIVAEVRPKFFVAENVPGLLGERNAKIVAQALANVPADYKILTPTIMKASDFGVPTSRRRVFFVGYNPNEMDPLVEEELFKPTGVEVNVGQALRGLPTIRASWQTAEQGWRRASYSPEVEDFTSRLTGRIPLGVGDEDAIKKLKAGILSGNLGTEHTAEVVRRFRSVRPGQVDAVSRAPRLAAEGFCPTLRAGTNSDRGSFQALRPIHHSSPRVITPREAARLQGFPDWFQFHETKWHSFRQIGNSVSPPVAEALLSRIRSKL